MRHIGESKENDDYWTVSSTIVGEYSEEEVYNLEDAKSKANDWSGVVQDKSGDRVHVSDGYKKARARMRAREDAE